MKINQLICDNCGKKKDLYEMKFGGSDDWITIKLPIAKPLDNEMIKFVNEEIHVCNSRCLLGFLEKNKDNLI